MQWLALLLTTTVLAGSDYSAEVSKWRQERESRLKAPDGWLSVAGLTWLKPGENPMYGGVMLLAGGRVTFRTNGRSTELKPNSDQFVTARNVKLSIIHRGVRYGVRVRYNNSEYRRGFTKLEWYPVDPSWRIQAKYVPFNQPQKKLFDSQTGDKQEMIIPGVLEWRRGGQTFRLSPILEGKELFLVFRDTTAGKTTYPAARFLYASLPSESGKLVELDFNKAYNPPCAFTPYATCPLPPRENRLTVPVHAGEKNYKAPWNSR